MSLLKPPTAFSASSVRQQRIATALVFFVTGLSLSVWTSLVFTTTLRSAMPAAAIPWLFLLLGMGSLIGMAASGACAVRWGCRPLLLGATSLIGVCLLVLVSTSNPVMLVAAMLLLGIALGVLHCTANIQAVWVERACEKTVMSGFYGLFSLGLILGAISLPLLNSRGLPDMAGTAVVVVFIQVIMLFARAHLLPAGSVAQAPALAIPRAVLLLIGVLCFTALLSESTVRDLSDSFVMRVNGVPSGLYGLTYAVFIVAMTLARLAGDAVVRRIGAGRTVMFGALLAAVGLLLATLVPVQAVGLLGFALVGVGCANIVPVCLSAAGRQQIVPASTAIVVVSVMGYVGTLTGSTLIGWVGQQTSLGIAFMLLAVVLLGVAGAGRRLA